MLTIVEYRGELYDGMSFSLSKEKLFDLDFVSVFDIDFIMRGN